VGQFRIRQSSATRSNDFAASPKPAAATTLKPSVSNSKPVNSVRSAPSLPLKQTVKPKTSASAPTSVSPSVEVDDDHWGGGGAAEIKIDLDDKSFGKY
jgi:hypothetical protein